MEDKNGVIDFAEAKYRSEHPEEAAAEDLAMRVMKWHLDTLKAMSINQEKFDNMEKCVELMEGLINEENVEIDVHRDALSTGGWGATFICEGLGTMDMGMLLSVLSMADGIDCCANVKKHKLMLTLTFKGVETPIR